MRCACLAIAALAAWGATATAATLHTDTFEVANNTLGWSGRSPTQVASGGALDGGGFLRITNFLHLATYNPSPAWTGNLTAIGATSIRAHLMAPTTSEPLPMRIVLFGPATTGNRWTSADAQVVPNDGVWREYTFSLAEGAIVRVPPSDSSVTHAQVMANTLQVMFRYDPGTPSYDGAFVDGVLGIDNAQLVGPAPKPGDFDGDGRVTLADLDDPTTGFRTRYGTDLDGNSFLDWQKNLELAATPAGGAVPEPGTLALVMAAAALGIWRPRIVRSQRTMRAKL